MHKFLRAAGFSMYTKKKDIEKLIKKYQKKYQGKELYYFIKRKLYQKGYREEEIGDVLIENIL